ncbi:MAG TPA: glycosyltransferase family A protein [Gemmataceae bacterium]|nr:glycosyltransferase family A protein [Gemmataceae bacterium]
MGPRPTFSLIVPTRSRPEQLCRFLDSVTATARHPDRIEVVLVIDADDPDSLAVGHPKLHLRRVVGPPGRTMGALNTAGYEASSGEYVMLLNDDVIVRTRGWDAAALACFRRFPDPIVLVHVNDTLIREHLCVFPLVSRAFCELAGGICPQEYRRYRIDDHIEDVFNLLAALGVRRSVYLPDVVFEHTNAVEHPEAGRVYMSDPDILALDAPLFESLFPARKELALRALDFIEGGSDPATAVLRYEVLNAIADPFALRTAGRQHVMRAPWWKRARNRYHRDGCRGLIRAVKQRITSVVTAD